jgi:hypothetical protein
MHGMSLEDSHASSDGRSTGDAELAQLLDLLRVPASVRQEILLIEPEARGALTAALGRLAAPRVARRAGQREIETLILDAGVDAAREAIADGIERFGLNPHDFLRAIVRLEEAEGERTFFNDRMPMSPLALGGDQMQIFRATFGIDPPTPSLLRWWTTARRSAVHQTIRAHDSRTICPVRHLETFFRTGLRAPMIQLPPAMVCSQVAATIDLLRSNPRYRMGLIDEMPTLTWRAKGTAMALVCRTGFALGGARDQHGQALLFTDPRIVAAFQASFDQVWETIPRQRTDSAAIADWLEAWLPFIGCADADGPSVP